MLRLLCLPLLFAFILGGDSQETKLSSALNKFSSNLYQDVSAANGNFFISPFSASVTLGMLALGAKGETYKELWTALGFADENLSNEEMAAAFHNLLQLLRQKQDGYELELSNSMWIQDKAQVLQGYKKAVEETFYAEEQSVDFSSSNATDTINKFVSDHTKGKIEKLFDSPLDSLTVMVLVNAMYFKGTWVKQFNVSGTTNKLFHNSDGTINDLVPTMTISENFAYSDVNDLNSKVLEMPYKGKNLSMFFVLPHRNGTLNSVEQKLMDVNVTKIFEGMSQYNVLVQIPKFKLESSVSMEKPLRALNINKIFDADADLSGISVVDDLHVSEVQQKSVINVNEEGSEAAVASGVVVQAKSLHDHGNLKIFKANRPFFFFLLHKPSGTILSLGRVSQL